MHSTAIVATLRNSSKSNREKSSLRPLHSSQANSIQSQRRHGKRSQATNSRHHPRRTVTPQRVRRLSLSRSLAGFLLDGVRHGAGKEGGAHSTEFVVKARKTTVAAEMRIVDCGCIK